MTMKNNRTIGIQFSAKGTMFEMRITPKPNEHYVEIDTDLFGIAKLGPYEAQKYAFKYEQKFPNSEKAQELAYALNIAGIKARGFKGEQPDERE